MGSDRFKYHAFVSHAVEDKLPVANELCRRLEQAGLKIWYSGKELKIGDSLEEAILDGLNQSQYGIVILSPTYIEKNWTRKEYYLLMAREIKNRKVILPVLFNITTAQLAQYDISIADKWAINYEKGIDHVVHKLLEAIKQPEPVTNHSGILHFRKAAFGIGLTSLMVIFYFVTQGYFTRNKPDEQFIESAIATRIHDFDADLIKEKEQALAMTNAAPVTLTEIKKVFNDYQGIKKNYRNIYEFRNGFKTIQSKKNVVAALGIDVDSLAAHFSYGLTGAEVYLASRYDAGRLASAQFILVNSQSLKYAVVESHSIGNDEVAVTVSYRNNLRYVMVDLVVPAEGPLKKHAVSLKGFLPVEMYVFEKRSDTWVLKAVE